MTSKLTLSIEKETIEGAKILSSKTGKSISKMVEDYLNSLLKQEVVKTSAVEKLSGVLKGKAAVNMEWKDVKANYIKNKYGL